MPVASTEVQGRTVLLKWSMKVWDVDTVVGVALMETDAAGTFTVSCALADEDPVPQAIMNV
jgi:hypothetical protein